MVKVTLKIKEIHLTLANFIICCRPSQLIFDREQRSKVLKDAMLLFLLFLLFKLARF